MSATTIFKKLMILISVNLTIILIFAGIYYSMKDKFNGMDNDSTFLDCFYFSCTTFSSVGYGDISPATDSAKVVVIIQQFLVIIGLASMIFGESSNESVSSVTSIAKNMLGFKNKNNEVMQLNPKLQTVSLTPTTYTSSLAPTSTYTSSLAPISTYSNPLINSSNTIVPSPALQQANYMNMNRSSNDIPKLLKFIN